jgi:hypothetical protein
MPSVTLCDSCASASIKNGYICRVKMQFDLRAGTWAHRAMAVCCVLLIALTGFVVATHFHPKNLAAPDRSCTICALAHAGVAPAEISSAVPILGLSVPIESPAELSPSFLFASSPCIRPPPQV